MIDLKEWLYYKDGKLFWKKKPSIGVNIGDEAGCLTSTGHKFFYLKRKNYKVHRVVYWWFTGEWPEIVDHKEHVVGKELDNSFENLRAATRTQNNKNRSSVRGSTSQYLGVSWKTCANKWVAHIRHERKLYALGYFEDEEEAARAYDTAASKFHGEFANLNFKSN